LISGNISTVLSKLVLLAASCQLYSAGLEDYLVS